LKFKEDHIFINRFEELINAHNVCINKKFKELVIILIREITKESIKANKAPNMLIV